MKYVIVLLLFITSCGTSAQKPLNDVVYSTAEDKAVFERYRAEMEVKQTLPLPDLIVETAKFFLGTPYVASTLEKEPEGLVVNLRELDCSTFVESVLALSLTMKEAHPSFDNFCRNLQWIRYRDGEIAGYASRLHYTSDWLYENGRKGIVKDISREIGGERLMLNLNFMSTHPGSYKQLKDHPERVKEIAAIEKEINARTYYYLPEQKVEATAGSLQPGDMVCITTSIKGLDISHVGFIYKEKGMLTFIHASTLAKKVIVNQEPLSVYLSKGKSSTGVMIARPSLLE